MTILLSVKDLSVRYGPVQAVRSLSFGVVRGEVLTILGSNGAGKTSSLRGVMGLQPQMQGDITLKETRISGWRPEKIARSGIALVPQGRRVFASLTVEENLYLGAYRQRPRAINRASLRECYELFPVLEERKMQRAGYLSGGEQQMLAFGRALMAKPDVILMDEPSMGLAPIIVSKVMKAVRQIADSGIGVVMVEQNAAAALKVADNIIVLELGSEVFRGPAADAQGNLALVRAFLGEAAIPHTAD